jgi:hypothetical protein
MDTASGQRELLNAIIEKLGGCKKIADKLGVEKTAVENWKRRGKVPVSRVAETASLLRIVDWGLNYEELVRIRRGINPPRWEKVIRSYGLPEFRVSRILFLTPPKSLE